MVETAHQQQHQENLKDLPQHQKTESSDGDVGSLIDCLEDEEDEDDTDRTPEEHTTAAVDCSYADKYRHQQRLNEAEQLNKAKVVVHTAHRPPPPVQAEYLDTTPRPDGLAFNLKEPWQYSMMKQLENPEFQPGRGENTRIFVGHTESRDYAVSWDDEASAFSLDTTASSTVPARAQVVHRMMAPPPRIVGYHHNPEKGTYTLGTPEDPKPEGRDDSISKPMTASPRTVTQHPTVGHHRKSLPTMGNYVGDVLDDSHNNNADPACYCLGYNMLDYLLIGSPAPTRRRRRPMAMVVEEEPLDHHHRVIDY